MPQTNAEGLKMPTHIAFIMDGNGRWAKKRLMPRTAGHREGAKALKAIIRSLMKLGVEYATFYAFSTENWNRPEEEVSELMRIFDEQLDSLVEYEKENVRLCFIGDRTRLSTSLQEKMAFYEEKTADRTGLTVLMAINYGGYDEICRGVKSIVALANDGFIRPENITPDLFASFLDTKNCPPVDLMIRTGGEERISNFLIWQIAYAELYFCPTLWPDFKEKDLLQAIKDYSSRDRRFGKVKATPHN